MEKLTKAVSFYYKNDQTSPSIIISSLKKGFYCSVVRYNEPFAKGKQVICNAKGESLSVALKELANKFLSVASVVPKDPIQELSGVIRRQGNQYET